MEITGSTTVYAIAADPIAHVKRRSGSTPCCASAAPTASWSLSTSRPTACRRCSPACAACITWAGWSSPCPTKEQAAVLCDEITPAARLIGAVNAIRLRDGKLAGGNFDRLGFVAGLRAQGHEPAGRRVYLAGLGGAGKAIACALADAGPARLDLYNRSPNAPANSPRACRPPIPRWTSSWPTPRQAPIARSPSTPPRWACPTPIPALPLDALPAGAVVADAVMSRVDTPLLRAAAARLARTPACTCWKDRSPRLPATWAYRSRARVRPASALA